MHFSVLYNFNVHHEVVGLLLLADEDEQYLLETSVVLLDAQWMSYSPSALLDVDIVVASDML